MVAKAGKITAPSTSPKIIHGKVHKASPAVKAGASKRKARNADSNTKAQYQRLGKLYIAPLLQRIEKNCIRALGHVATPKEISDAVYEVCRTNSSRAGAPVSGYILYFTENREQIVKDMTVGGVPPAPKEVTSEAGRRWKAMKTTGEANKYKGRSDEQKKRTRIPEPGTTVQELDASDGEEDGEEVEENLEWD
jgi:hypothetical protein